MPSTRLLMIVAALSTAPAYAGPIESGIWSHACGTPPSVRHLDLSSRQAYEASIDPVLAYRQAQQDYLACLQRQGSEDIRTVRQTISTYIKAEVDIANAANARSDDAVRSAEQRFSGPGSVSLKPPATGVLGCCNR